jgi:putative ABC transport system permease protein
MSGGRLSTARIAMRNITHRGFRSGCIVLLVAITTLLITGGTLLGFSVRNGVESISARLGSDAMIVPEAARDGFEGALLNGSPSTFYLPVHTADRIMRLDGVERAATQLFISTFDSSHCGALVQIIGYDPAADFVIAPWLNGSKVTEPGYGEVVIGGNVELKVGEKFPIFAVKLDVVGVLDKTGMGFDNSVFVNMETAQMLLGEYKKFTGAVPLPEGAGVNEVVSAVLLDFKKGTDLAAFRRNVNIGFRGEGVRYVSSQTLLQNTSKNLGLVIGILTVLLAAVWVFSFFGLAVIFVFALNERQREFGILRAIGATRRKLTAIVLTESTLLCGAGAALGIGVVCLIVFSYNTLIERVLRTVYLPLDSGAAAGLLTVCFVLDTIVGPLASLFSVARIGGNETLANIREGL